MTSTDAPAKTPRKRASSRRTSGKSLTKAPARTTKYPWEDIRAAFVDGMPGDGDELRTLNLREIADEFDVPYQRVKERSASERWAQLRHDAQTKLHIERQKKRFTQLANDAVDFDDKALGVAKVGIGMVTARLGEISKDLRRMTAIRDNAIARQERGEKVERWELYSAINYRELQGLADSAERFQSIGRRALGTDIDRHEITGADGGPIESVVTSVNEELVRDDPERLTQIFAAMDRAGIFDVLDGDADEEDQDDSDVVEADLVEDQD